MCATSVVENRVLTRPTSPWCRVGQIPWVIRATVQEGIQILALCALCFFNAIRAANFMCLGMSPSVLAQDLTC